MTAPSSGTEVFRFIDLPPEIRNAVYKVLLCNFPLPDYQDDGDRVDIADQITLLDKSQISTSILRTNRQIYEEARAVLIKTNLFVQVEFHLPMVDAMKAHKLIINRRIPMLIEDGDRTEDKRLLVMTYAISSDTSDSGPSFDLSTLRCLVLHRELDNFVLRLANADNTWLPGLSAKMKHQVIVHTFGGTGRGKADREFLGTRAVQERLLAPFVKHLRGVQNFTIKTNCTEKNAAGKLDEALVAATISAVKKKAQKTTAEIFASLQNLKEKGTEAFKAGDARLASENWSRACMDITRVRRAPDFVKSFSSKPQNSPERKFVRDVAEMIFLLNLNLAQNTLVVMQKSIADGDFGHAEDLSRSALSALERAFDESSASEVTGLPMAMGGDVGIRGGWKPTHAQMAKLWFRKAKCHRLCKQWDGAYQAIGFAKTAAPTDAAVLAEEATILDLASATWEELDEIDEFTNEASEDEISL
ncbi:peptidyl-prolyl isomerase D [Microdochium nivale]|nr:peptidyl-prolyl isomerase D [Microdochium nivale]